MRSRNIKPGFFINEKLGELSYESRLLFIGLWCAADCDGLLEYRPGRIKMQIFPYDKIDIEAMIDELVSIRESDGSPSFLIRYYVNGTGDILQIQNFKKHQNPHPNERSLNLPTPLSLGAIIYGPETQPKEKNQAQIDDPLKGNELLSILYDHVCIHINTMSGVAPPKQNTKAWGDWRKTLRDLVTLDKYSPSDIDQCLRWLWASGCNDAVFWRGQVQSIPPLRLKKKNDVSKFAKIFTRWKSNTNHTTGAAPKVDDSILRDLLGGKL